ncbi:MAG TPA: redoxin domain-containing protein [Candidatus Limnocylindria bacterium]|nr:redoxin domain-containing protein [Candidatus Limnocylindria bacterium]
MTDLWMASLVVLWIIVLFLGFLLIGVLRQVGLLHLRLGDDPGALITRTGLDRGITAPDFDVDRSHGGQTRLSDLSRVARALVFVNPTCVSCHRIARHLREVAATRAGEFDFIVVCRGDTASCSALAESAGLKVRMVVDPGGHIEAAYQVRYTPFAYVLDYQQRVLVRGVVNNWQQLDALLDQEGVLEPMQSRHEPLQIERKEVTH